MNLNDMVLVGLIILMLAFAVYDEFIVNLLKGKTYLQIKLKRKHRIDTLIFIILTLIVVYNNITSYGSRLTTYLLLFTILVTIYIAYIRSPKLFFKNNGFFYANTFISYNRIKTMNLSEDGILVIGLENKKLYISVSQLDDLERIYKFLIENK
ncbi:hypothetical protein TI10_00585 [Photorhabdus luminescens subsp. luminescens]|uniref:UPF0266 membrane protein SAMN02982990_01046 n=2 Tax=Photorhabdus luminescens TaxID=29488 RepID=A0A1G5Q7E4_PHOLU|nr:DUF986 family protein [Photorhabdus luminescens]KMW74324.1 hypothetical protein TI10_00585 [Photorhabdus luminescens subsp. luminescens]MCW7760974.1 DUF986 family protein [Photorhabdus luminescens subsp. venezuelensis]OWO80156.1 hypothetical protein B5C26_18560 [Photorhabdus luminescens]TDB56334.1 DUF986 domain-containing protein [Photorhabdus luminescens subsp. mexicana]SCZ57311.1 Uncharacterized membrane protein YobD, UPF0266 family [Photorhabdus luminescens]